MPTIVQTAYVAALARHTAFRLLSGERATSCSRYNHYRNRPQLGRTEYSAAAPARRHHPAAGAPAFRARRKLAHKSRQTDRRRVTSNG